MFVGMLTDLIGLYGKGSWIIPTAFTGCIHILGTLFEVLFTIYPNEPVSPSTIF